ncbi:MAG: hypothetical protein WC661_20830 [Opitutaceae bacterium]|jgi:hypothetical protein
MLRVVSLFLLTAGLIAAAPRTFTDQTGRTITAELLSVQNGQATIRRTDGQTFTLATTTLSDDDQKFIIEWNSSQPAKKPAAEDKFVLDPKKLTVGLSRGKFDSHTLAQYEGYVHKHEDWGYTVQITNSHLRPIEKIRIEYNLFARTFSDISSPSFVSDTKVIEKLKAGGSETFRTRTAEVCKRKDIYFGNESGELRGVWIRLYVGDQLITELSSPDSLMTKEKWTKPSAE